MQSLVDFVAQYAARGNEVAVRYRRGYRMETWTYARIAERANCVARELEFRGIGKGDAVLLWGENSPEWIIVFFRMRVARRRDRSDRPRFNSRIRSARMLAK